MLVPLPVIAHGAALGGLGGVRRRDAQTSVHRPGGPVQQLHGVDGLAHVAAAPSGDKPGTSSSQVRGRGLRLRTMSRARSTAGSVSSAVRALNSNTVLRDSRALYT